MTSPLPLCEVASTKSTSPPAPVTARPVATPGTAVRTGRPWNTFCRPDRWRPGLVDRDRWRNCARCDSRCRLAQDLPSSRSRLRTPASRVYSSITTRTAGLRDRDRSRNRCAHAAAAEVALGDGDLLVDGVPVEAGSLPSRSSNGPRIPLTTFAVAMNTTSDRSRSTSR